MKKQRHSWLHYFIIVSMMWLPVQISQASMAADMMQQAGYVCEHAQSTDTSMHTGQHHQHAKSSGTQGKLCDDQHNCADKVHCAKCSVDKHFIKSSGHEQGRDGEISYSSDSYFHFYSQPELRPPQL